MASAAIKALKEVRTAFEEGLLDEEQYSVFRNLFVESRTRILERDGRGERSSLEAVGSDTLMAAAEGFLDRVGDDRKVDEVSPSASPVPEEPEEPNPKADKVTMVEENTKASSEGPSVPRTPELVGPISRAPTSPAPRPRRMRSSPVFFDPVPPTGVKSPAWEDGEEPKTGCAKCRYARGGCARCEKVKCDAYLNRWLNDKSTIFSWVFQVIKDAGEGGLHVLDICSRIAKQTDISALTGSKSQHDAISHTCRNFPLVFATVGKKESGRYRIAEAYLPVQPKRHCPAKTVPPKRVKRAWEDSEEPKTGCAKCKYIPGGCARCEKVKSDAYLNRWGKDKSKLFSWVFQVIKEAGEEGLHKRDICSRIAKQTDISALTTMEEPHSAIGITCTNYPLIFARVGEKGSGRYRIVDAYL
ncbi:hypothetical protein HKI87_02g10300 [Chloropicon roscoffensis]|uniref:Uncharacterized protein n=1 Tax=Chloropicon roscoffensis TaxID=1461544 RepID=A0AAX4NZX6_9CHLO